MGDTMGFAVVGLAVVGSISVAVVVEWFALWGLMKMMPGPEAVEAPATATTAIAAELRSEFHERARETARAAGR